MAGFAAPRLVAAALRCYPAAWRRRHADEAAELAALLIRDGAPAWSIALSYLAGAAREWLTPSSGRGLSTAACALLVAACSVGLSIGLLVPTAPAKAASTSPAHGAAHCRPRGLERVPVPGVPASRSNPLVAIQEPRHAPSC